LLADVGDDDGIERLQEVLDHMSRTKTRLGKESCLDENDVGLSYTKTFLVVNKIDAPQSRERLELLHEFCPLDLPEFLISAQHGEGLENLRTAIYTALDVVRVYTKLPTHKEPDYERPFTLRRGSTLLDIAELIHKDFAKNLKHARVWGSHVHDGTPVKGDYVLHDRDVVEIHV
jgi:ribosome-interacting GTPase 1